MLLEYSRCSQLKKVTLRTSKDLFVYEIAVCAPFVGVRKANEMTKKIE